MNKNILISILGILIILYVCNYSYLHENFAIPASAYANLPSTHFAAEMPLEFFDNIVKELVGREIIKVEDTLIDELNKKLPSGEKHKFKIVYAEHLFKSQPLISTTHCVVYRNTKMYGVSITIEHVTNTIITAKVNGFIFEDQLQSTFSPA